MTATTERIPFYPNVETNLLYFQLNPSLATVDNVNSAMCSVGRVNGPALLFDLFYSRTITDEVLAHVIGEVWSAAEYPEDAVGCESWLEMFEKAGYTVDGKPSARPTEPITLYRGSTDDFKHRMCWTSDIETAKKFASGKLLGRQQGKLWAATVEPIWLLAHINDRKESEYVIDPTGLDIQEVEFNA